MASQEAGHPTGLAEDIERMIEKGDILREIPIIFPMKNLIPIGSKIYVWYIYLIPRWWFQIYFMFIPTWGDHPI